MLQIHYGSSCASINLMTKCTAGQLARQHSAQWSDLTLWKQEEMEKERVVEMYDPYYQCQTWPYLDIASAW